MFKIVINTLATTFAFIDGHVNRVYNDLETTLQAANSPENNLILAN